MNYLKILLHTEILGVFRKAHSWMTPLLFFVVVVSLFPLAIGPDKSLLTKTAAGIIWVSVLLAVLISLGNVFMEEKEEGSLDLLLLSPHPLPLLICCKIASYWLVHCVPLILFSPLLGLLFNLSATQEWVLVVTLLLGTPVLCFIGAISAALSARIEVPGLLLPVLVMPFYVPVLVFGTGAVMGVGIYPLNAYFAMMGAFLLLSLALAPFMISAALRIGANL